MSEEEKLREELELVRCDLHNAYSILDGRNEEIERLNKLMSQREKKWEKWTTEKTILSTKMSDYLCKYQNIKREYTKQIKISTDRKKEIERLNEERDFDIKYNKYLQKELAKTNSIIKEAREYIEDVLEYEGKEYTRVIKETLIKILDKENK